jgi:squalene-hopene/tetraprenyl-beta-curcumene cyclase
LVACDRLLRCLVADDAESDESESLPTVSLTVDTALAVEALQLSGAQAVQPPVIDGLNWLADSGRRRDYETTNTREVVAVLRALARPHEGGIGAVLPPEIHLTPDRLGRRFRRARGPHARRIQLRRLRERLCQELLSRQQSDGGWSAWNDPHPSRRSRGVIRAADGSPQQDSAPDATGNIVEVLALHGLRLDHPAFGRAVAYLRMAQQADGSWDSATGARFIHGTGWAVRGLVAAGSAKGDSAVAAGVNWLLVQQHESGGWGEAVVRADDERDAITAAATAIQTAWALLALITAGHLDHEATRRGVEFLLDAQRDDGNWFDSQFTQRDSASGSWYRNDLYSTALPLIALARWARAIGDIRDAPTPCLRLVCDESPA